MRVVRPVWLAAVSALALMVFVLTSSSLPAHTDWGVPNIRELQSILSYGMVGPAVSAAFNSGCTSGCTVTTCSCTSFSYWASTSRPNEPDSAWYVAFHAAGDNGTIAKHFAFNVRAVRGGL